MKISKLMVSLFVGAGLVIGGMEVASAASVLDATAQTAISTGFTNLQDTVKDILTTVWPFALGIAALVSAPGLVKKLVTQFAK